jgi:hypothetical protein
LLPGYGKTASLKDTDNDKGAFLESAIMKLVDNKKKQVILASPAVSGLFSLALLKKNQECGISQN